MCEGHTRIYIQHMPKKCNNYVTTPALGSLYDRFEMIDPFYLSQESLIRAWCRGGEMNTSRKKCRTEKRKVAATATVK